MREKTQRRGLGWMPLGHDRSAIPPRDWLILDEGPLASVSLTGQTGANAVPAGGPLKIALPRYQTMAAECNWRRMQHTPFFLLRHVLQPSDLPGTPTMSQRVNEAQA